MKKIVLSIAAVMAAAAFAPEASALPVFARQTGMACTACHFQHFPLLNGFGRAFKNAGFTMMGAQGKIEGEELSIPDTLNMSIFTTAAFQTQSNQNAVGAVPINKWLLPANGGEMSLFVGGRIAEFAGFLSEVGLGNGAAGATAAKLAMLFPVGDARVGLVMHSSNGQGAAYSFETLNTGAAATHKMMGNPGAGLQHIQAAYAAQYLNTAAIGTGTSGVSLVANNTMGFVNIGRYEGAGLLNAGANTLPLTYARVAGTFDLAGFDAAVGIQNFSGSSNVTNITAKATVIDAQMQGELAGYEAGFYASYGKAPVVAINAVGAALGNTLNGGDQFVARSTLNVAAEMGLIPHGTIQAAFRMATREGMAGSTLATLSSKDNAFLVGATYELAQNMGLSLHYTTQSGSYWTSQVTPIGKTATTLLLETAF
jgi:hypothetical protein